jgi:3-hydroxyanthranilate 3,4-dioxygenase
VIERKRNPGERDGLRWYCAACNHPVYEEFFVLENIETQFAGVFDRYYRSRVHRTCNACGHVNPAPSRYLEATT